MQQRGFHFTAMEDLSVGTVRGIMTEAKRLKEKQEWENNRRTFVANLFYEPSTRTRLSFETAERKLGFEILNVDVDHSSVQKGESLYDTVKTLEAIGVSAVVIRHPQKEFYKELADVPLPIVNAGDGSGEHPSQCLLDLMTIHEEFGRFQGLKVSIIGDVCHSRVARSNVIMLKNLGVDVTLSGPKGLRESADMGCPYVEVDQAVAEADVVMLLRLQHERHTTQVSLENYHERFGLTAAREKIMKPDAIIMHPGPFNRGVEIASELVEAPRSRIFKQVQNGVYTRMAILRYVLRDSNTTLLEGVL